MLPDSGLVGPQRALNSVSRLPGLALKAWFKERALDWADIGYLEIVAETLPPTPHGIVKRRAQLAGLRGHFSAHSLRSGFILEASRQNAPLGEAML